MLHYRSLVLSTQPLRNARLVGEETVSKALQALWNFELSIPLVSESQKGCPMFNPQDIASTFTKVLLFKLPDITLTLRASVESQSGSIGGRWASGRFAWRSAITSELDIASMIDGDVISRILQLWSYRRTLK
jgi:hypothetical protein